MMTALITPAIISLIAVLPFICLELINRKGFNEGFPFPLFVILWLLAVLFILILMPVVRNIRQRKKISINSLNFLVRIALSVFIAFFWIAIILDQMPCFLGDRFCD